MDLPGYVPRIPPPAPQEPVPLDVGGEVASGQAKRRVLGILAQGVLDIGERIAQARATDQVAAAELYTKQARNRLKEDLAGTSYEGWEDLYNQREPKIRDQALSVVKSPRGQDAFIRWYDSSSEDYRAEISDSAQALSIQKTIIERDNLALGYAAQGDENLDSINRLLAEGQQLGLYNPQAAEQRRQNWTRLAYEAGAKLRTGEMDMTAAIDYLMDPENEKELHPEDRDNLLRDLDERRRWSTSKQIADQKARSEEVFGKVYTEIEAGNVASWDQINADPDLTLDDKLRLDSYRKAWIRGAQSEAAAVLDTRKKALLQDVETSLNFEDFDRAQELLILAVSEGAVSGQDPDVSRAVYIVGRKRELAEQKKGAKDAEALAKVQLEAEKTTLELRLLNATLTDKHVADFAQAHPTEHEYVSHLREQFEQQTRTREARAKERTEAQAALESTDPQIEAEVIRRFYDTGTYSDRDVQAFIKSNHGPGADGKARLSNNDVKAWLDKLKNRKSYFSAKLAVDMVSQFYDGLLKEERNEAKILESRIEEAGILKRLNDAIAEGKYTDQGLLELGVTLLAEPKRRQVRRLLRKLDIQEPEKKQPAQPAGATLEQDAEKLLQGFRDFKRTEPVQTGELDGKPAFSDGKYWWIFDEQVQAWKYWEGEKWVIETKSLTK